METWAKAPPPAKSIKASSVFFTIGRMARYLPNYKSSRINTTDSVVV
jgi:hypothetical protein